MKHVEPVSYEKQAELERELVIQKERFLSAGRRGLYALKADLSVMNWIRAYPRESAVLIILGTFVAVRILQEKRREAYRRQPNIEVA